MCYDNMTQLVTDWMGDDVVLREIAVQLGAPALVGDLSWCTGEVVAKREEDGRKLVELYIWITKQRDERTTACKAIVEFASRAPDERISAHGCLPSWTSPSRQLAHSIVVSTETEGGI